MTSTDYNARIEYATRGDGTDVDERLLDALTHYSPATGRSERGWVEVHLTVPATGLHQAITTALALAEPAQRLIGAAVLAIEVLPTAEFDARQGLSPAPETVGVPEAARLLGVTPQAVRQRLVSGSLPGTKSGRDWRIQLSALTAMSDREE